MEDFAEALSIESVHAHEQSSSKSPTPRRVRRYWLPVAIGLVVLFPCLFVFGSALQDIVPVIVSMPSTASESDQKKFSQLKYGQKWICIPKGVRGKELEPLKLLEFGANYLRTENHNLSDKDLKYITCLPLKVLNLSETKVSNEGLRKIAEMKTLESLVLDDCERISDKGVSYLEENTQIIAISLRGTGITSEAARSLSKMPNLRMVDVGRTAADNESVALLQNLRYLRVAGFAGSGITGDAFYHFRKFPDLRILDLSSLNLKDEDFAAFSKMTLNGMIINNNPGLTDATIAYLDKIDHFRYLSVFGCDKISLVALLKFLVDTNCKSDSQYFQYFNLPESLEKDHWGFYCDPDYYEYKHSAFLNQYGPDYNYHFDREPEWLAKLRVYSQDPKITSQLSPEQLRKLKELSTIWLNRGSLTTEEVMMKIEIGDGIKELRQTPVFDITQ